MPPEFGNYDGPESTYVMLNTYKNPVAKTIVRSIFFFSGMRSLQTQGIGSIRVAKSEMTLKIPLARYKAFSFV